jgi:deoxyribonuclease V
LDVHYVEGAAIAGCILFEAWTDAHPKDQLVASLGAVSPYRSGQFYLRELPALMAVLERVDVVLETVIVDAYVWLGAERPGLGAHLHTALGGRIPVVGVAKTAWSPEVVAHQNPSNERRVVPVRRQGSTKPLYVTSVGRDVGLAAALVAQMHGEHRIPTLLKAVDRLARL